MVQNVLLLGCALHYLINYVRFWFPHTKWRFFQKHAFWYKNQTNWNYLITIYLNGVKFGRDNCLDVINKIMEVFFQIQPTSNFMMENHKIFCFSPKRPFYKVLKGFLEKASINLCTMVYFIKFIDQNSCQIKDIEDRFLTLVLILVYFHQFLVKLS